MIGKTKNILAVLGLCLSLCLVSYSNLYAHDPQALDERQPVCLKEYPTDPSLFNDIVRPHVKQIIEKHGFQSKTYFAELDKISVNYWLEWDRADIFTEMHY